MRRIALKTTVIPVALVAPPVAPPVAPRVAPPVAPPVAPVAAVKVEVKLESKQLPEPSPTEKPNPSPTKSYMVTDKRAAVGMIADAVLRSIDINAVCARGFFCSEREPLIAEQLVTKMLTFVPAVLVFAPTAVNIGKALFEVDKTLLQAVSRTTMADPKLGSDRFSVQARLIHNEWRKRSRNHRVAKTKQEEPSVKTEESQIKSEDSQAAKSEDRSDDEEEEVHLSLTPAQRDQLMQHFDDVETGSPQAALPKAPAQQDYDSEYETEEELPAPKGQHSVSEYESSEEELIATAPPAPEEQHSFSELEEELVVPAPPAEQLIATAPGVPAPLAAEQHESYSEYETEDEEPAPKVLAQQESSGKCEDEAALPAQPASESESQEGFESERDTDFDVVSDVDEDGEKALPPAVTAAGSKWLEEAMAEAGDVDPVVPASQFTKKVEDDDAEESSSNGGKRKKKKQTGAAEKKAKVKAMSKAIKEAPEAKAAPAQAKPKSSAYNEFVKVKIQDKTFFPDASKTQRFTEAAKVWTAQRQPRAGPGCPKCRNRQAGCKKCNTACFP